MITDVRVRRLVLRGTICRGAEYLRDGRIETALAEREVVLTASTTARCIPGGHLVRKMAIPWSSR